MRENVCTITSALRFGAAHRSGENSNLNSNESEIYSKSNSFFVLELTNCLTIVPFHLPSLEKTSTSHKLRLPSTPTNWMATYWPTSGRAHVNVFVVPSSATIEFDKSIKFLCVGKTSKTTYRQRLDTKHRVDFVADRNYCFQPESPSLATADDHSNRVLWCERHEPFVASANPLSTTVTLLFASLSISVRRDFRYQFFHRFRAQLVRHALSTIDLLAFGTPHWFLEQTNDWK